jgi:hypothetical protein
LPMLESSLVLAAYSCERCGVIKIS